MRLRRNAAVALLLFSQLHAAEPRWLRLQSGNFEMYTTASERSARETLKSFEQVHTFFSGMLTGIPGKALPVTIVAFNSKKEYEPYRLNNFAQAYYHSSPNADYIVLGEIGPAVFPVAVHEYVHLVVRHLGLKLPPWLNEGLAELYSTLRAYGNDKIMAGDLIPGRFQALHRDKWVPLSIICSSGQDSPYYNEKDQAGSLYNEGWALTHMLLLTPRYRTNFDRFMNLISSGTQTADALVQVYGKSVDQVDKELQDYLAGSSFRGVIFPQKLESVKAEIPAAPASDFDVHLMLAQLMTRPGKEAEAQRQFEQLAKDDPKRPEPWLELGYLKWRGHAPGDAREDFRKAYALGYREKQFLWDYGRMIRGVDNTQAIAVLSDLLKLEPDRVDVRLDLAAVQLTAKKPEAAMETLAPLKSIPPENASRYFLILAHAQLDRQMWSEARQSAEALRKFAQSGEDQAQAAQIVAFLDGRERPKSIPPPASSDAPPPAIRRAPQTQPVTGTFVALDCSESAVKIILEVEGAKKIFAIDAPDRVVGETLDLVCGVQKKKMTLELDTLPSTRPGIDGLVRGIHAGN